MGVDREPYGESGKARREGDMTPTDLTTAQRPAGKERRVGRLSPALLLVVPAPEVAGRAIPDPQNQGERAIKGKPGGDKVAGSPARKSAAQTIPDPPSEPWTPPVTNLPRSFVQATAALFEAGVADPCVRDHREIHVENPVGAGWS